MCSPSCVIGAGQYAFGMMPAAQYSSVAKYRNLTQKEKDGLVAVATVKKDGAWRRSSDRSACAVERGRWLMKSEIVVVELSWFATACVAAWLAPGGSPATMFICAIVVMRSVHHLIRTRAPRLPGFSPPSNADIAAMKAHSAQTSSTVTRWLGIPLQPAWLEPLKVASWCVLAISAAAGVFQFIATMGSAKREPEIYIHNLPPTREHHFEDLGDGCAVLFPQTNEREPECKVFSRTRENGTSSVAGTDGQCTMDVIKRLHDSLHVGHVVSTEPPQTGLIGGYGSITGTMRSLTTTPAVCTKETCDLSVFTTKVEAR